MKSNPFTILPALATLLIPLRRSARLWLLLGVLGLVGCRPEVEDITETTAILRAVSESGDADQAAPIFEWGLTTDYGASGTASSIVNSSGMSIDGVKLSELTPGTLYHYRLNRYLGGELVLGTDRTFTTLTPPLPPPPGEGELDPTFNGTGVVVTGIATGAAAYTSQWSYDTTVQPDSKTVVAGYTYSTTSGAADIQLVRYNVDGSLDTTFGTDGRVLTDFGGSDAAVGVHVNSDGALLVGALTNLVGYTYVPTLVRYSATGVLDTTFGTDGKASIFVEETNVDVTCMKVQADGKVLVGGSTNTMVFLVRFNADGTADTTFGSGGKTFVDVWGFEQVNEIALASDGRIYVTGTANGYPENQARMFVASFLQDGSANNGFGINGVISPDIGHVNQDGRYDQARALAIQPDGKIVVGVAASADREHWTDAGVMRFTETGALDTTFGQDGITLLAVEGGTIGSVQVLDDGKIAFGGGYGNLLYGRLTASGAPDTTFRDPLGYVTVSLGTSAVRGKMRVLPNGKVVIAGTMGFGMSTDWYAVRLLGPGSPEVAVFDGAGTAPANERADNIGTHSFGNVALDDTSTVQTFTVQNKGAAALTGLTLSQTGHTGDFTLGALGATTLAGNATTTFTVRFTPAALGDREAVVVLTSNDENEGSFEINVSGTGVSPEIVVEQPLGTDVADGGGRAFGSVNVGSDASLTFTILNSGTADLTGLTMTKDGAEATDFTVTATPVAPVASSGAGTTFSVRFAPGAAGVRNAVLHIVSNDGDENPFDIALSGTGLVPGTLAIGAAVMVVNEEAGIVQVPVTRTGGSDGAVSVMLSTFGSTAMSGRDYLPLTNYVVNFADGDMATKMVPITILADTLTSELSEAFTLKLTTPTGGAVLGAVSTATVKISEADTIAPVVTIIAPSPNVKIVGGIVTVSGQANDSKGLLKVEVSLNGGAYVEAALTLANPATSLFGTWKLPITPAAGVNTVTARSVDLRNSVSVVVSRTFSYVSTEAPFLTISPAAGGSVTFTPALVGGKAQIGVSYTLKATAKIGYFWHEWTAPGVSGAAAEAPSLTIVITPGLAITANFVTNEFRVGTYTGLAQATGATIPGQNNLGLFSGTLATTGKLTGKVTFGGTATSFVATFDKITGDAAGNNSTATAAATLSYDLNLDLTGGGEKITGTVTQIGSGDVSAVDADKAAFGSTNKLPAAYLKPGDSTKNGTYTVVFPSLPEQDGLTSDEYPGGDGFGTVTLTPVGLATLVGTMADGTAVTGSAPLSKLYEWPLAAFVKSTATVTGMTLGGVVKFDPTQSNSDLSAEDVQWFRPARAAAAQYPAGWPNGILVNAVGAHYNNALTVQASLGLGSASPTNGQLVFAAGGLTAEVVKTNFKIVGNVVTKIPTTDTSYTLSVVQSSGAFSGTFTPNWGTPIVTKPSFKGIILQKGESQGGYGFFLNNGTGAANKQAGGVTLGAP